MIQLLTTLKSYFQTGLKPTQAQFSDLIDTLGSGNILTAVVTIPTASVLTLNTVPYQIVPTPGVGYAIQAISGYIQIKTYGGVAYATNTQMGLIADTATAGNNYQMINTTILGRTVAATKLFALGATTGAADDNNQLLTNKALMAYVYTGNPTAGNSDITINVCYRIVTL